MSIKCFLNSIRRKIRKRRGRGLNLNFDNLKRSISKFKNRGRKRDLRGPGDWRSSLKISRISRAEEELRYLNYLKRDNNLRKKKMLPILNLYHCFYLD